MTSIRTLLKNILMLIYYLLTQPVSKDDVYEEFFKHKHLFDFSVYQSKFFDPTKKKIIGKMKDDYKGIPINEFIGLKSKMYAILADNNKKSSKAKEVNIPIDFRKYKDILFKKKMIRHKMKRIQSKKHIIRTCEIN